MVVSLLKCPFSKDDRCPNFDHSREDYDRDKHMAAPSLNRSKDVGNFHLKNKMDNRDGSYDTEDIKEQETEKDVDNVTVQETDEDEKSQETKPGGIK